MTDPSAAEIRRVHQYECKLSGHSWQIVETTGHGPTAIVCSHCGEQREIFAPDANEPEPERAR